MRRTLIALIVSSTLVLTASVDAGPRAAVQPQAVTVTTFLVSGRGWGHGVGMSQYGALGFANEGRTFEEILGHFYPGTALAPADVTRVRVLVAEAKGSFTVTSKAPYRVRDVFGTTYALPAGPVRLGPKLELILNGVPTALAGPIVFLPGKAPLEAGTPYRGQLEIAVASNRLNAINVVGLESYLAGVVPREMPAAWPAEALKAQAVAARSYALAHRLSGKSYDLHADVRSQVYGGIAGEDPRATAAIEATAGQVLLYEGKVADTLFHSTSGGRTVSASEAFGTAVPYLVSVDDPHSSLSSLNRWGPTPVSDTTIRKGLRLAGPVLSLRLVKAPSGRVRSAVVTTAAGPRTITGGALRSALGLRSTWVTALASLSLTRPGGPVVYGKAVAVTGKAAGVRNAVLSQLVDGAWKPLPALAAKVKLQASASFRLSAGAIAGPVLRVPVAPLVTARLEAQEVSGTVRPLAPGLVVELQVERETGWSTMAETTTGPEGEYALAVLEPGVYRIRVAPARGLVAGLSATIRVE
jgi:stage II sporulation protein D